MDETRQLASLISLMGNDQFEFSLLCSLNHWVTSKHFSILRIRNHIPSLLMCGTDNGGQYIPLRCGESYIKRYHMHDVLYQDLIHQRPAQHEALMGQLEASEIIYSPYRKEIYEKNDLIQRLCGLYRDENDNPILLNLYRHKEQGYYSDQEIENFRFMIPALGKLIQGHLALKAQFHQPNFKQQLLKQQPELTLQEVEVCTRILKGMSYIGIATEMSLKESTVKTYRNRAFAKLGINFKSQLFALMLQVS